MLFYFQWIDYLYDAPTLIRHCFREMFTVNGWRMIYYSRIIFLIIVVIFYVISPLDLIPEAVFGFLGLVDDLLVILMVIVYASMIYRQVVLNRANE